MGPDLVSGRKQNLGIKEISTEEGKLDILTVMRSNKTSNNSLPDYQVFQFIWEHQWLTLWVPIKDHQGDRQHLLPCNWIDFTCLNLIAILHVLYPSSFKLVDNIRIFLLKGLNLDLSYTIIVVMPTEN